MATSSFFYGESGAPAQDTWDALLEAIEDRVEASATNASTSATNAANSETAAAASAATASVAKTDAESARDTAVAAKTAAETAQTAAATSASQASTSETNAASSASSASASASTASTAATNAGNSATSAASSESSASTSASTATTKASEASTSAANAASSASDAAASATAADSVFQRMTGKNKIVNPNFAVNQLAKSGVVTLAAGEYGHDQWKAGAAGCTYTFSTTNNVTTLNITAGSLQQTMEGASLFSGVHTLSWQGTAQGKIGAGAYGASGQQATITGGTDTTVEFGIGTLSLVQFEPGAYASLCETRHPQIDLAVCQRYYEKSFLLDVAPASNAGESGAERVHSISGAFVRQQVRFQTAKRAAPTVALYNPSAAGSGWRNLDDSTDHASGSTSASHTSFTLILADAGLSTGKYCAVHWTASARL